MGLVTKAFTFAPQTLAASAEVNVNFDTLYALVNGNIEADNLAPNAVVADKITDDSVNFNKIDWGTGADQVQGTELTHWRIGQGLANYLDIALPVLTGNRTWTLQDSSDVFVGRDTTDTLTNKTLTSPTINAPDINGGTWNGTIDGDWDAAGQTCANLGSVTTVDINGGRIDGTFIGGTVRSQGNFTTVDCSVAMGAPSVSGDVVYALTLSGNKDVGTHRIFTKTIILPEYVQGETDVVPLLPVENLWAGGGIKIVKFGIKTNNASSYSCVLEDWSNPATHVSDISTVATSSSMEAESGTLSYEVAVGNIVMVDLPTTTGVKWLQVWFVYRPLLW